jgi:Holliday junction resolvasome RuvABC ATP-dependent DNA helicase subunit
MDEFEKEAPALLSRVLGQLRDQSQRVRELVGGADPAAVPGLFDLSALDPHTPGAFGALGTASSAPEAGTASANPTEGPTAIAEATGATGTAGQLADPSGQTGSAAAVAVAPAAAEAAAPSLPAKSLDELLAELDELVGLDSVKEEIHRQSAILRVQALRSQAGLKDPTITRHLVFVGNPGTGKTTVARLVGGIYRALGLLSQGQLVEVDRSELVAGYLGQTAIKTAEVAAKALGGVLFIDEAYALSGDQYGEEAINTLVKEMEDHRGDLVVIVAGYPTPMERFIAENPGLASRFRTTIAFADYADDELAGILRQLAAQADYDLSDAAEAAFRTLLAAQPRDSSFGNGRFVRNVFEAAIGHQAWRLRDVAEPTTAQLRELLPTDIDTAAADEPVVSWPPEGPASASGPGAAPEAVSEAAAQEAAIRPEAS